MSNSLHDRIVAMIPSKDLQNAIRTENYQLSALALLATVCNCAPDFSTGIEYLKQLEAAFSGELRAYTARIIKTRQQMLDAFLKADSGAVYELHIKDTPDAFDETYLCGSFEAAMKMIPLFYQEYGCSENEKSRYRIVKRRVFSAGEGEPFSEDYLGEAVLMPGGIIQSLDMRDFCAEDCDGLCMECERYCVRRQEILYPCFTNHGDSVKYRQHDGTEHIGVVLQWDDAPTNECYIIPIDDEHIRYRDFKNAHYGHIHIPAVFVERIPVEILPEKMQENYLAYAAFLKDNSPWG